MKDRFVRNIKLYSRKLDDWIDVRARIDTGSDFNCISPAVMHKGGFSKKTTSIALSFDGAIGRGAFKHMASIKWQPFETRKDSTNTFYVAPNEVPWQILIGKPFIKEHNLLEWRRSTHLFVSSTLTALNI